MLLFVCDALWRSRRKNFRFVELKTVDFWELMERREWFTLGQRFGWTIQEIFSPMHCFTVPTSIALCYRPLYSYFPIIISSSLWIKNLTKKQLLRMHNGTNGEGTVVFWLFSKVSVQRDYNFHIDIMENWIKWRREIYYFFVLAQLNLQIEKKNPSHRFNRASTKSTSLKIELNDWRRSYQKRIAKFP